MAGFGWPNPKWNLAIVAPGVGDDIDDDYQPGSVWIDTAAEVSYFCIANTRGAAVWEQFAPAAGFTNPMTTLGDIIRGGVGGAAVRLAIGSSSYVLMVDPATGIPFWSSEVVDARSSTFFGSFASVDARLENIEAILSSVSGLYSYDFSLYQNSMYAALGVW